VYLSTFNGTNWSNGTKMETFTGDSGAPSLAYGTGERAMIVWSQQGTPWSIENRPGAG